jgi:hypothetical protein
VNQPARLTTVMGVARAVLATVSPRDAARVLRDEFGWDASFHALALLSGEDALTAFGETWSALVLDDLGDDLGVVSSSGGAPGAPRHSRPDRAPG